MSQDRKSAFACPSLPYYTTIMGYFTIRSASNRARAALRLVGEEPAGEGGVVPGTGVIQVGGEERDRFRRRRGFGPKGRCRLRRWKRAGPGGRRGKAQSEWGRSAFPEAARGARQGIGGVVQAGRGLPSSARAAQRQFRDAEQAVKGRRSESAAARLPLNVGQDAPDRFIGGLWGGFGSGCHDSTL